MAISAPQDLGPRTEFQNLAQDALLAILADTRKHLANVGIDILVDGRQVARLAGKGVAGVEEHDGHGRVQADEALQLGGRRLGQLEVVVAEARVELDGLLVARLAVADQLGGTVDDQVVKALGLELLKIEQGKVGDQVLEVGAGAGLGGLGGLVGDVEAGAVADDRLEGDDVRVVEGGDDVRVKLLGPDGEGVVKDVGGLGRVVAGLAEAADDVGGDLFDAHDALAAAAGKVVVPGVGVRLILAVEAVVDQDGLDAGQAVGGPVLVPLQAALLDGGDDGLPGVGAAQDRGQLADSAEVG